MQAINFLVFHSIPGLPVWLGGALVIAGGLIITGAVFKKSSVSQEMGCPNENECHATDARMLVDCQSYGRISAHFELGGIVGLIGR